MLQKKKKKIKLILANLHVLFAIVTKIKVKNLDGHQHNPQ